ncbi:hypothetical protein SCLCIDRAFT_1207946 [Scleroderma citrinum Foug A]|uniref:Uncharacterized protein n=1 Tax=Scleroderma citrinum Foug A TaxID=1036808 RepID=A0A0C3A755_9AGAM|nr:hypothetical protein SCLCIDRAFT_1207946 [Scleroderma citrinum Foug A]
MSSITTRTSLRRSPRTVTRKPSISRPPPLQMIPELSENEYEISPPPSPTPTRPLLSVLVPSRPSNPSPRVTLSSYTFSIDDALLMFGDEAPGSPALSASSSTSGSASSEEVPTTPSASDDESCLTPSGPRVHPRRVTIRPLCINKPRSFMCLADENFDASLEQEVTPHVSSFPELSSIKFPEFPESCQKSQDFKEDDHDFYAREFQDFISFYSEGSSPSSTSRPDSIIMSTEASSLIADIKPRGRSRFSKPLPSPPLPTPPLSTFPSVSTFPLVQTTAQSSFVRRKRNAPPLPKHPPPPPPVQSRPPPRMAIPADIGDTDLVDDVDSVAPGISQIWFDDEEEDIVVYSQSSVASSTRTRAMDFPAANLETPIGAMYGVASPPRKSIDSDAPRSSTDSYSSSQSSEPRTPMSPFSFPSTPSSSSHEHNDQYESSPSPALRSRWSTSTLGSLCTEPARTGPTTLLSPLKTVFGGRAWKVASSNSHNRSTSASSPGSHSSRPRMHIRSPSKVPDMHSYAFRATSSSPSTPERHVRRRGSRSSTSSSGTSHWSECDSCESNGSPGSGLKRKPIPVEMFIRA